MREETQGPRPAEAFGKGEGEGGPIQSFTFGASLLQFFIIPALVVAMCVGVFLFFGWMVADEKGGLDYLREVKTGSSSRRWQAAFELSKWLTHHQGTEEAAALAPAMVEAYRSSQNDDPRVRRYLTLCLGHLKDSRGVPVLIPALSDGDAETQIYAIWALGSIGDPSAIEPVTALVSHDDGSVRKMAVYGLGALKAESARETLQAALNDPVLDVAWNAAVALTQIGDGSGRGRLLQMMDRAYLAGVPDLSDEQEARAMITALQAAARLADPELRERMEAISASDPNLKVRQAAFEALAPRSGAATSGK